MKTSPSPKIFKPSSLIALGIAITAVLVSPSALAQPAPTPHQIVLTENSSTSLTATYDGSTTGVTVTFDGTFLGADFWHVTFPSTVTFSIHPIGGVNWIEPENSSLVNEVEFPTAPFNDLVVSSDFTEPPGLTSVADESTVNNVGTDSSDGASISVTFDDDGDVATVPDTGSTFVLLALALIALSGAATLRSRQLA
jgi:hypothetical protein